MTLQNQLPVCQCVRHSRVHVWLLIAFVSAGAVEAQEPAAPENTELAGLLASARNYEIRTTKPDAALRITFRDQDVWSVPKIDNPMNLSKEPSALFSLEHILKDVAVNDAKAVPKAEVKP